MYPRLVLLLVLLAAGTSSNALAAESNATILFPPLGCSAGAPYITWDGSPGQTTCQNAQQILFNALLPTCTANQIVVFDGTRFVCRSGPALPDVLFAKKIIWDADRTDGTRDDYNQDIDAGIDIILPANVVPEAVRNNYKTLCHIGPKGPAPETLVAESACGRFACVSQIAGITPILTQIIGHCDDEGTPCQPVTNHFAMTWGCLYTETDSTLYAK